MLLNKESSIYRTLPFEIAKADSFFTRFKGLMFRNKPLEQEGLWITPCNSIHMFFMSFPLDIVFLNKENQIVKIVEGVKPWKVLAPVKGAHSVVELPVHTVKQERLEPGQYMKI